MASSPLPGGPRHVGRVIDPSVREDGEPEPALELEPGDPSGVALDGDRPTGEVSSPQLRGAPLRKRLLERAFEAQASDAGSSEQAYADLDQIGLSEERSHSKSAAAHHARAPSAPLVRDGRARLSPNQQALFITLLGIATVASLIALVMNLEGPQRTPEPVATSAPSHAQSPPAAPAARPKRVRQKLPGPWRIEDARNDANLRLAEGEVGSSAFLNALEKVGIPQRERYRILTSMKGVRSFDRCKKTDRFRVLLGKESARVQAFEYIVSSSEVYQSREGGDGLLKGTRLDLKVQHNQVTGSLLYDGESFDGSAERGGFDSGLRKVVVKALDGHLDPGEIERGDRFRIVAQEQSVLGEFGSYTGVEALELRPVEGKRSPMRVYYFDRAGERGYYDAEGRAPYEGGWRKPVKDAPVTSPFNMKRMHPVLKKVMPHTGIDFGAPAGTPVGAASFGTVSFLGYSGPSGNLVKLDHPGGVETGYAHLSRFAEGLKVGDRVRRLGLIGYVGSTGRSTGPHLHFTASRDGRFFDPATLKFDAMRVVSKDGRAAFFQIKAKYDGLLDSVPLADPLPWVAKTDAPATPVTPVSGASHASVMDTALDSLEQEERPAAPGSAQPRSPAVAASGPGPGKSMVHLTDKELLELSRTADDGEIGE